MNDNNNAPIYADPTTAPAGTPVFCWTAPDADGKRERRFGTVRGYVGASLTVRFVGGGSQSAPYRFKSWIVADETVPGFCLYAAMGAFESVRTTPRNAPSDAARARARVARARRND